MAGTADETWTNTAVAAILVLHTGPARCGARHQTKLHGLSAAPFLLFAKERLLPHHPPKRHDDRRNARPLQRIQASGLTPAASAARSTRLIATLRGSRPPSTLAGGCADRFIKHGASKHPICRYFAMAFPRVISMACDSYGCGNPPDRRGINKGVS
jgi:hypothetical protein